MTLSERWLDAYNARDQAALETLIDDDFVYVRQRWGKDITKDKMVNIWLKLGERPRHRDFQVVCDNDEVARDTPAPASIFPAVIKRP